ncbi:Carboxyvinyl-carboxyphosphonatephosphorylmutase [Thermodesulfobium narugense DSM 14796]|uniref:Carboxyvinyl-carboxyphosphonatephosphorylmutase n=1 Tax=Thermodesulfobium narugense DSM 14796 TaxID=747365 RepID=M1E6B9_9BACT|nr:isocitrate lyase/PEP mutase family protein [Thermodesulfobium narugense]AEE14721.1 Carboxyvinyl-carboxyphosphonatephosphorylmutase [Thermodesulfobium narugense DSM 14796]
MSKAKVLLDLIKAKEILVMPGAYDCLSAKMVELAGFKAVQMSGYGFSASLLGKPDIGLLSFDEILRHTHNICNAVNIPVMADADTGYGNSLNVIRTVQEFEQAGAAGINLEDQVWPKRCGHMEGKDVIPAEEMVKKIEAAFWAKKDKNFVINARTDARQKYGPKEAIRRAKLYWEAGADLIFLEAPESIEELKMYANELVPKGIRISVNMLDGGRTPLLSFKELEDMGFSRVSVPVLTIYAAAKALYEILNQLYKDGTNKNLQDKIFPFQEFNKLIGLPEIRELEKKFLSEK